MPGFNPDSPRQIRIDKAREEAAERLRAEMDGEEPTEAEVEAELERMAEPPDDDDRRWGYR